MAVVLSFENPSVTGAALDAQLALQMQHASMARAMSHYEGQPPRQLRVRPGEPDDNVLIASGLGKLIVDKGVSMLFGQPVPLQVEGGATAAAQDWLDEATRRLKWELLWQRFSVAAGIAGQGYLRLLDTRPWPRAVIWDPLCVTVQTAPDDVEDLWSIAYTTPPAPTAAEDDPHARRVLVQSPSGQAGYKVDVPEQWTISDQIQAAGDVWQTVAQEQWPYPFCPVVTSNNLPALPGSFLGQSDLPPDVCHTLDVLNRVLSQTAKIIRVHASPKVWLRGAGARNIDISSDSVTCLPSEVAELRSLEMQSNLDANLEFIEKLLNLLSMQTRVPLVALGQPDNQGALSGVSLQIRYAPLIDKTEQKRLTIGDAMTETARRLVVMAGLGEQSVVTAQWPSVLPTDELVERQVAVLDDSLRIASKQTIAERLGYSYEQEQRRIAKEQPAPVPPPDPLAAPKPLEAKGAAPPREG